MGRPRTADPEKKGKEKRGKKEEGYGERVIELFRKTIEITWVWTPPYLDYVNLLRRRMGGARGSTLMGTGISGMGVRPGLMAIP